MIVYPYNSPIILTEDIFQKYGGNISDSLYEQRQVAYWLAEMAVSKDVNSFLLPTTVTGTYLYSPRILLEYGYVSEIKRVDFLDYKGASYWNATGTLTEYYYLHGDEGIFDLNYLVSSCQCYSYGYAPTSVRISYVAGLSTGTANQPDVLLAMTTYADIMLNEMRGYGNESVGDVGVQNFNNQQYREERVALMNTVYGNSPRANFAHKLMSRLRSYRYVGI